jgi:hypothetical protein
MRNLGEHQMSGASSASNSAAGASDAASGGGYGIPGAGAAGASDAATGSGYRQQRMPTQLEPGQRCLTAVSGIGCVWPEERNTSNEPPGWIVTIARVYGSAQCGVRSGREPAVKGVVD